MLEFIPDNHEYRFKGQHVPGVNEILKAEGCIPDFDKFKGTEYKRELGQYVHQAIRLHFAGTLDIDSVSGPVREYFEGFLKFAAMFELNPIAVEKPLFSQRWGFAGTPDCYDRRGFDWKCSEGKYDHYELTAGAYATLIEGTGVKIESYNLVILKPYDYTVRPVKMNKQTFLAMLLTYQWKKERGFYESTYTNESD